MFTLRWPSMLWPSLDPVLGAHDFVLGGFARAFSNLAFPFYFWKGCKVWTLFGILAVFSYISLSCQSLHSVPSFTSPLVARDGG